MLTRQEIEEWHDPPCTEQAEWLLKLVNGVIDFRPREEEIGRTKPAGFQGSQCPSGPAPQLSSPDFCREKAEECLALSYQITDPKNQVAVLKLAKWWMRVAERHHTGNRHQDLR
jgi:hypothetical protein